MLQYTFRKIGRNLLTSLLMVVQLAFSFLILNAASNMSFSYRDNLEYVKDIYGRKTYFYMRDISDQDYFFNVRAKQTNFVERLNTFYRWTKSNDVFRLMSVQNYYLEVADDFKLDGTSLETYRGENRIRIKAYRFDKDFLDMFPLKIASGRSFAAEEFEKSDVLPIIMGKDYEKYYKIGDVIDFYPMLDAPKKMKVIGFMEENSYFATPMTPEKVELSNSYVIYPFVTPGIKDDFSEFDMLIFQSVIITENRDLAAKMLQEKARELDLFDIELGAAIAPVDRQLESAKSNQIIAAMLAVVVLAFTFMTSVSSLVYRYRLRKSDYARFLFLGAKRWQLALSFLAESGFYVGLSAAISLYIAYRDGENIVRFLTPIVSAILCSIWLATMLALRFGNVHSLVQREEV